MQWIQTLTLDEARPMVERAIKASANAGCAVSVAICDEAGNLVLFERMCGARSHTIELACQKARLSAQIGIPTAILAAAGKGDVLAGGMPILVDGKSVGSIGVSGATPDQDGSIAEAAIESLLARP